MRSFSTVSGALGLSLALLVSGCATEAPAEAGPDPEAIVFPNQNRPDVRGVQGAVSSDHPLATAAGLETLRRGGNATDAIITMAGVLAVVRPHMNGVGGDAFGLFFDRETGAVEALNGSGRAGALATPGFFASQGRSEIPEKGALSVSVPGAVAAWADALERHGTMDLAEVLEPAIRYARNGFPVSVRLARDIAGGTDGLNDAAAALYTPGGSPPPVGTLLKNEALAATLERIAREGKDGFYRGPVARSIAAFLEREGGYVREGDLAAHRSTWVDPLSSDYLDHRFLVLPPNTQGIAQLQQFEMSKSFDYKALGLNTSGYIHTLIELKKIAFADRNRWVADPTFADLPIAAMMDADYLSRRAGLVDPDRAAEDVASGVTAPAGSTVADADPDNVDDTGDTVYLTAVDQWGNGVSWIQSLFQTFGSGLLEPETGVVLQDRGALFTLEEGHPNRVEPGKRPYHTLTPLMALRADGSLAFTMGTPGGDSQTQSLLQIVNNLLLFGMTPQEAIEAPRYRSYPGLRVAVEDRFTPAVLAELTRRGHELSVVHGWTATFGGAQMIYVEPGSGTLTVASDPRREAYGLAY